MDDASSSKVQHVGEAWLEDFREARRSILHSRPHGGGGEGKAQYWYRWIDNLIWGFDWWHISLVIPPTLSSVGLRSPQISITDSDTGRLSSRSGPSSPTTFTLELYQVLRQVGERLSYVSASYMLGLLALSSLPLSIYIQRRPQETNQNIGKLKSEIKSIMDMLLIEVVGCVHVVLSFFLKNVMDGFILYLLTTTTEWDGWREILYCKRRRRRRRRSGQYICTIISIASTPKDVAIDSNGGQ